MSSNANQPSSTVPAQDHALVHDLVLANHILFERGVVDAFGHVSARSASSPDRFLLSRNKAPGTVTAEDIMQYDLDSKPLDDNGRSSYLERFIHGQIYKAYPHIQSVVHSHSPTVVPFSLVKNTPFCAVCHTAGFIGVKPPVFEIRDYSGDDTDLLISSNELGAALALCLGSNSVVLMRGHGSTVAADSLKKAVQRAVYTEVNARTQAEAMRVGEVIPLTAGECASSTASNAGQVDRAWNLWKKAAHKMHMSLMEGE
jgi:HCOMODA/2-hydroxy-3-carboxy-muconic semialdehyde decarboxylase